jgi:hypothetical protein
MNDIIRFFLHLLFGFCAFNLNSEVEHSVTR